jgi:predicted double-glycine peptidase
MFRASIMLVLSVCLCGLLWAAEQPALWLDVPFVRQAKDGCGSASVAMVMEYWSGQQNQAAGLDADAGRIQQALYSRAARGIYASDLERYFQDHGFLTFAFAGEWADLKQHLEKGRPLIVALRPRTGAALHYVVVAGLGEDPRLVLVNDPAERKLLKRDWPSFEREWRAAGQWTLLALPQPGAN